MNIEIYKMFIDDLLNQGIKVNELTLLQLSYSLNLYKKVFGGVAIC